MLAGEGADRRDGADIGVMSTDGCRSGHCRHIFVPAVAESTFSPLLMRFRRQGQLTADDVAGSIMPWVFGADEKGVLPPPSRPVLPNHL